MQYLIIEIKARCDNQDLVRKILKSYNADFKGVDHQIDTYFKVKRGKLKLREGSIENCLLFYEREVKKGPKQSKVTRCDSNLNSSLKEVLARALGVLVVVDKRREIYFIDNIKFHLDNVKDLGAFVEIEAIDRDGSIGKEKLLEQCKRFLDLFRIPRENLISGSYSDLLLTK